MEVICRYCGDRQIEDYCTQCNHDIRWIKKAYEASDYYYAKGYYAVEQKKLTKGIAYLKQAIYFNKYHIEARNLLGLCLLEIGEVDRKSVV